MPALPVDPVRVTERTPSLFSASRRRDDWTGWEAGVSFSSGCHSAHTWPRCDAEPAEKIVQHDTPVTFDPIVVYKALSCEWVLDTGELDTRARSIVDATTAQEVARAILGGETDHGPTGNPSLASAAMPAASGSLTDTIGQLLAARADCPGRHVLWVPVGVLPALMAHNLVHTEGDALVGPGGALVVADNSSTPIPTGDSPEAPADGAGEAWLYLSGPIEYEVGPINVAASEDERRLNRYEPVAERLAVYRFDPCCIFAGLATVSNECCAEPEVV
jgi:hypothetical protein